MGASLAAALAGFPLPILAGLLIVAGLLHIALLKDLRHPADWAPAIAVGVTGFLSNLAIVLIGALLIWWTLKGVAALRARSNGQPGGQPTRSCAIDQDLVQIAEVFGRDANVT